MGKIQSIGITAGIILFLLFFVSFRRDKPEGIIGVDIETDSVKIISFNLRYGMCFILIKFKKFLL